LNSCRDQTENEGLNKSISRKSFCAQKLLREKRDRTLIVLIVMIFTISRALFREAKL